MAIAHPDALNALRGVQAPRIAPPTPAKSRLARWKATARTLGLTPMPWQSIAARYMMAIGPHGWMYPEVCIVVARQNGKTELLTPRILDDLRAGRRILHTAQNRTLPRKVFIRVARALDPTEVISIRYANGQEKIEMQNGGEYTIVAPQRGARGLSADTLIFDEVREFEEYDIIEAATPTLTASHNPQTIYLSNAGSDVSVVLNDLKRRAENGDDEELAYLEWSAAPERSIDDRAGWAEANPSLGHFPKMLRFLETQYASVPSTSFETEHLCRWVTSMQPKLVSDQAWMLCRTAIEQEPVRPALGFNMDPSGKRASIVMAWQMTDGRIACVEVEEAVGEPIDVDRLGLRLKQLVAEHGVKQLGFASWTDKNLARHMPRAKPIDGKDFTAASENFVRLIQSGRLAWDGAMHITDDLGWTARKPHDSGAWMAVPTSPERSVTAVLAGIRAVALASAPRAPAPRIG
jgi:hypothetical protein